MQLLDEAGKTRSASGHYNPTDRATAGQSGVVVNRASQLADQRHRRLSCRTERGARVGSSFVQVQLYRLGVGHRQAECARDRRGDQVAAFRNRPDEVGNPVLVNGHLCEPGTNRDDRLRAVDRGFRVEKGSDHRGGGRFDADRVEPGRGHDLDKGIDEVAMGCRDKDAPHGHPVGAHGLFQGTCGDERLVDRKRDDVKGLKPHCCVDLRIRYERHLDFARDCAKSGNPQVHVSCREATLLDAALHCNSHRGNVEDHAINNGSRREGDLTKTQELRPSTARGHFGHTDRAAADLDTHASRNHQRAPDTEDEPTVLQASRDMLAVRFPTVGDSKVLEGRSIRVRRRHSVHRSFISAFSRHFLSLLSIGA